MYSFYDHLIPTFFVSLLLGRIAVWCFGELWQMRPFLHVTLYPAGWHDPGNQKVIRKQYCPGSLTWGY